MDYNSKYLDNLQINKILWVANIYLFKIKIQHKNIQNYFNILCHYYISSTIFFC